MKHLNLLSIAMIFSVASFAQAPITGSTSDCIGVTTPYSDATTGGTWSSSNSSVATINATTGLLTGVMAGTTTVTYTLPSSAYVTLTVTMNAAPCAIMGTPATCAGGTTLLTDCLGGGVWSSAVPAIVSITAGSGVVTGVSLGTAIVTYADAAGCYATISVAVSPLPVVYPVSGGGSYCAGGTGVYIGLAGSVTGVSYSLYNAGTVAGTEPGTGAALSFGPETAAGAYTISASASSGCTSDMTGTAIIIVNPLPNPYPVSGGGSYCAGGAGVSVGLSASSTGVNYQLYCAGTPVGGPVAGTGTPISFGMQTVVGSYTVAAINATTGCTNNMTGSVTVSIVTAPAIYTVSGGGSYCAGGGSGSTITLSSSDAGVTYTLDSDGVVDMSLAGTGSSLDFGYHLAGAYTIIATSGGTSCAMSMAGTAVVAVGPLPAAYTVTGGGSYCAGGAGVDVGLSGSNTGVNYQLYDGSTAVGGPIAGTGSPLSFGLQTVAGTYTVVATNAVTGCTNTMTGSVSVSTVATPAIYTVSGGGSYCTGGTSGSDISLSSSSTGVIYTLDSDGVADMTLAGTGSSLDFGDHFAGTFTVTATSGGTSCTVSMTGSAVVAAGPLPSTFTITGGGSYCSGGTGVDVGLDGSDAGINYQLYNGSTTVGTPIAGTGAAISFGLQTAAGTYTVVAANATTSCTSAMTGSAIVTVSALPTVTATASSVACDGSYILTAGGATSYSWAPGTGLSCVGCASPSANPSATTSYIVTGTDASGCTNTASVSVDGNRIMGSISPTVSGTIEVWLIQFNPGDSSIYALDSQVACTSGGSQYYNFADPASGNYMVKTYLTGGTPGASGYIPTYGTSSAHWYSATGITHSSATDNMNITMIYGTVPSGPGFISGFVASGAGRGTSVPAPSVGMLIYLTDASGNVLTYTKTDGSGNYSFIGLANGTYIIYPEDYQYNTTASSSITLSSSSESVTGIDFKQFTNSMIIVPFDYSNTGVNPVAAQAGISVFPNPAADKLNINWENQTTGTANLVITDVLGREVYKSAMNINAASGTTQVGLQGIKDGIYLLTIKGENINYSAKVLIEE